MVRDARELRGAWTTFQTLWYGAPPADLSHVVSGYWAAEWDLRGQPPYRQKIVPYPSVHLTFRDGDALIRGPERGHLVRVLADRGRVFGVTFRPGCFRPFLGASTTTITGRTIPAATIFGPALPQILQPPPTKPGGGEASGPAASGTAGPTIAGSAGQAVAEAATQAFAEGAAEVVGTFLRAHLPPPDALAEEAAAIVARIQAQPQLTRVDALAREAGLGVRRLQRLFAEYVGLGPKWVIRRYRLHEVGERLASGVDFDWVGLADELGYADQAHFVRDFTAMVGEPPTRYAERYPSR
jgi:AraC-like DNA-binding protein